MSIEGSAPKMIKVDILDAGIEIIARPPGKQPSASPNYPAAKRP